MLQWSMASMDMQQANWVWSTTGDLTVNGSSIEAQGAPSSTFSGDVVLDLPKDAVPKRHLFTQTDGVDLDATFNISLQVLQVYRSNISLIEPTPPHLRHTCVPERQRTASFLDVPLQSRER